MFKVSELLADNKCLWFNISSEQKNEAWYQAQFHSNPIASYNAYINHICLHYFMLWLKDWFNEDCEKSLIPISPLPKNLASIWEILNGTAIQVGDSRLVIIPTETTDLEELDVPQEWVDINSWAADYYLAVQINLDTEEDESLMGVLGFATHWQLKREGIFSSLKRIYSIPVTRLTTNLSVMMATLGLHYQKQVLSIETLSVTQTNYLLKKLTDTSIYSPRLHLDVPFSYWAALLENEQSLDKLYNLRVKKQLLNPPSLVHLTLSQWFDQIWEAGWQSANTLINPKISTLKLAMRNYVKNTGVAGVKLIDLGFQLAQTSIVLLIAISHESDGKIGIDVQVHPAPNQKYLPYNLQLILLASGKNLQTVQSRNCDNYIQLNHFKGFTGTQFSIQLILGDVNITEEFII